MRVLTLAHLTFLEARQRRLLWIILVIGLLFLGLFAVGFYFIHREVSTEISRGMAGASSAVMTEFCNGMLIMGLYGVNSLGVLLAVLLSANVIAGEIASGAVQTIVTKPLRRWEVVAGKWLGLAVMLALFTLFLSGGLIVVVWGIAQYLPRNPAQGVGLMVMEGLVFLTLSVLGGTRLSSLGNGVVIFMLYGLAFVAGWVEQIGALLHNVTAERIGVIVSLLIPGEAMWRRAADLMQPSAALRGIGMTPFAVATAPSGTMVIYTAGYIVVVLLLAMWSFRQRDL